MIFVCWPLHCAGPSPRLFLAGSESSDSVVGWPLLRSAATPTGSSVPHGHETVSETDRFCAGRMVPVCPALTLRWAGTGPLLRWARVPAQRPGPWARPTLALRVLGSNLCVACVGPGELCLAKAQTAATLRLCSAKAVLCKCLMRVTAKLGAGAVLRRMRGEGVATPCWRWCWRGWRPPAEQTGLEGALRDAWGPPSRSVDGVERSGIRGEAG